MNLEIKNSANLLSTESKKTWAKPLIVEIEKSKILGGAAAGGDGGKRS